MIVSIPIILFFKEGRRKGCQRVWFLYDLHHGVNGSFQARAKPKGIVVMDGREHEIEKRRQNHHLVSGKIYTPIRKRRYLKKKNERKTDTKEGT